MTSHIHTSTYIYWTGPPRWASHTRCTGRCSITSQNSSGRIFSGLFVIIRIFYFIWTRLSSLNIIAHKSLKNVLISVIGFQILSCKPLNAMGSNVSMKTWQSWLFIPFNVSCSISTRIPKFEACPSGILSCSIHSHILRF